METETTVSHGGSWAITVRIANEFQLCSLLTRCGDYWGGKVLADVCKVSQA
jgi:hypothetical protein